MKRMLWFRIETVFKLLCDGFKCRCLFVLLFLVAGDGAFARQLPDASNPTVFFSLVADKLLKNNFGFGITNIPVQTNGVFIYSPAVQRLLQFSANVLDACTTNSYPTVFRPSFFRNANGDIFISGFQQIASVSGVNDPQLASPIEADALLAGDSVTNVYDVPWIIGVKKGLPNFNQFYMMNAVQVTRKLQVTKPFFGATLGLFRTNQMYIFSVSNSIGASMWNSYSSNYSRSLTVFAKDNLTMILTNDTGMVLGNFAPNLINVGFTNSFLANAWPGTVWQNIQPDTQLDPSTPNPFVVPFNGTIVLLTNSAYQFTPPAKFVPLNAAQFETNIYTPPLPHFGLITTNRLQVFILDGTNVIDYVHFAGPESRMAVNSELEDPVSSGNPAYIWSTNGYLGGVTPYGVIDQIFISRGIAPPPNAGGRWIQMPNLPSYMPATPAAEQTFFNGFYNLSPSYGQYVFNGHRYTNTELAVQAPYTPTRTVYELTLWQANDPLVHYQVSDLNVDIYGSTGLQRSDDLLSPLNVPNLQDVTDHFQPWGVNILLSQLSNVDSNPFNFALKDPLVWRPDNWNFPTNQSPSLSWLGRVHRGTPWQTLYLKSANVLSELDANGNSYGTNTWQQWTGDQSRDDAALTAPVNDWKIAGLLAALFNTNDPIQLISVNDSHITNILNALNGILVFSNSLANPDSFSSAQFDSYLMAGNSPQALSIANAFVQARASFGSFDSLGEILTVPELASNSPWLNTSNINQLDYGISDEAYEAIPSQLLSRMRQDSFGTLFQINGWNVRFTGSDGFSYGVQTSTNLFNWAFIGTNEPVQGNFIIPISSPANSPNYFYRSILLP